jgi:hypothetical protein
MLRIIATFLFLLVGACVSDVKTISLTEVDLSKPSVLMEIRDRLPPEERTLLSTFAVRHTASSAGFCGRPLVGPDGVEPRTIGEAIELTRAREATEKAHLAQSRSPKIISSPQDAWAYLISDRDRLITRQSILRLQFGPVAQQRAEWKELAKELAKLDKELASLKRAAS